MDTRYQERVNLCLHDQNDEMEKQAQTQSHIQIQGQVFYLLVKPIKHCFFFNGGEIVKPIVVQHTAIFLFFFFCISLSTAILCKPTKRVMSPMSLHGFGNYFWTPNFQQFHHPVVAKVTIYTVNKDKSNKYRNGEQRAFTHSFMLLSVIITLYWLCSFSLFHIHLSEACIQCSVENTYV